MKRLSAALGAIVIFAAACGSDASDVLQELGLSAAEADCFASEYEARDLDINRVLRADEGELTEVEQQAVVEVASACVGGGADTTTDTSGDSDSNDDPDDDGPDDGTAASDTSGDNSDPNSGALSYDDLSLFERAFADGMIEEGVSTEAAVCIINEFGSADISLLEFMDVDAADEPTDEMLAAIFRCGDELIDAGAFDFSSPDPVTDGVTYGDDPEMDLLWDMCEVGDGEACDQLFFISPFGSDYEEFGNTCGFRFELSTVLCADELGGSTGGTSYGDDPLLDNLYDECSAGNMLSCDNLFIESPVDSEYETYGSTCGGVEPDTFGGCASDPMFYGDDVHFDGLYDSCGAGDMAACDELYLFSAMGSEYESYGSSCGEIATTEEFGSCEAVYGKT